MITYITLVNIFFTIFIYGFFILCGCGVIGVVDKKFPKSKTLSSLMKNYWSEALLILCMITAAHFFLKGAGVY